MGRPTKKSNTPYPRERRAYVAKVRQTEESSDESDSEHAALKYIGASARKIGFLCYGHPEVCIALMTSHCLYSQQLYTPRVTSSSELIKGISGGVNENLPVSLIKT